MTALALQSVRVTPKAGDPIVSLAEVKAHLKVSHSFLDATLQTYLDAAIAEIDGLNTITGRALGVQTWDVFTYVDYGAKVVELNLRDFQTLVEVAFIDTQTREETAVTATGRNLGSSFAVALDEAVPYPTSSVTVPNLRIRCTIGANPVPPQAKTAVLLRCQQLFAGHNDQIEKAWHRQVASFRRNASTA